MSSYDPTKTCFFLAPIAAEGSETRRSSDLVLERLVKPAAAALDLVALRADEIPKAGSITEKLIGYLTSSRQCVADVSGLNANVMYELGVRHAARLPVAMVARRGEKLPFDLKQIQVISYDPDVLARGEGEATVRELVETLKSSEGLEAGDVLSMPALEGRLTDEEVKRVAALHMRSANFEIYRVLEERIGAYEQHGVALDRESLFHRVDRALRRSRRYCESFWSPTLKQSLKEYFENSFSDRTLRLAVERGAQIIESQDSPHGKREGVLGLLLFIQERLSDVVLEKALKGEKLTERQVAEFLAGLQSADGSAA